MIKKNISNKDNDKFKNDRKNEIHGLSKLLNDSNVSVTGEYGVGKTNIITEAAKLNKAKLFSIDYMNLNMEEDLSRQIISQIGFYWKLGFLIKRMFLAFFKYLIASITAFEAIYLPIAFSVDFFKNHIELATLIAVLPLVGYFTALLILFLSWVVLTLFTNGLRKKKYILLSEINFAKNFENLNRIIWTINSLFKKYRIIFESSGEIPIPLLNKFKCEEFNVNNSHSSSSLFEDTINKLSISFSNNEINKKIIASHIELLPSQLNTIHAIISLLPHRTVESIMNSLVKTFEYFRGEISILDFILVKYLFHKNKYLYKFINERYDEISGYYSNYGKNDEDSKKISGELFEILKNDFMTTNLLDKFAKRKILPYKYYQYSHSESLHFHKTNIKEIAPFSSKQYKANYFNTYSYSFLDAELLEKFLNQPLEFIKYCNEFFINIRGLKFDLFNDDECIKFIENIENHDVSMYDKIKPLRYGFSDLTAIELIPHLILDSRKNKVEFLKKLSSHMRMIFLNDYFYDKHSNEHIEIINEFNELHNFSKVDYDKIPKFFPVYNKISMKYMNGLELQIYDSKILNDLFLKKEYWNIILRNCTLWKTTTSTDETKTIFYYVVNYNVWGNNSEIVLEKIKKIRAENFSLYYFDDKNKKLIVGEPVEF